MATIQTILDKYRPKIDNLDLELLIAHELKKSREFILAHPEKRLTKNQALKIENNIAKRLNHEPLAYILGHKEFYGLDFLVTKDTLIPRPETELLVEKALEKISRANDDEILNILDIGTGSGNIIISIAKNLKNKKINCSGIDISQKALTVAKYNAKKNNQTKITFIQSALLDHFVKNNNTIKQSANFIILANLPYLSKEIYSSAALNVKKFEPKIALYSPKAGLEHYQKLFAQIKKLREKYNFTSIILEFSPEQKTALGVLAKKTLSSAEIKFQKDLAGKWRICTIDLI